MYLSSFLPCLFLLIVACLAANTDSTVEVEDVDVVVLTDGTFNDFINNNEYVLVEFYAPWCGHCKNLAPEYAAAASTLKAKNSPAVLAKVDATVNRGVSNKFNIQGYPTLKFFKSGAVYDYDAGRVADAIVEYVERKSVPTSRFLQNQEEIDEFVSEKKTTVLAYIEDGDVSTWTKVLSNAIFDNLLVAHVTDSSLLGDRLPGTVEIRRDGNIITDDGANQVLLSQIHKAKIQFRPKIFSRRWTDFILDTAFSSVETYSAQVASRAESRKRDLLVIYASDESTVNEAARAAADKFGSSIIVAISADVSSAASAGASGSVDPTAIFTRYTKKPNLSFIWNEEKEGDLNAESLISFVEKSRDETYESFLKSEPIPEDNDGDVTILVGKTLPDALKSGKDVFVKFYAPWCGHCKNMAPAWEELGAHFKEHDPEVVIAKFDATANKVPPQLTVKGYPTIIYFTADGRRNSYDGERDLASMIKFVESKRAKSRQAKKDL